MEELVIQGSIVNYIYQAPDSLYKVAKINTLDNKEMTIIGFFPYLQEELNYEFTGSEIFHVKYGWQLKIETFKKLEADTKEGIVSYLSSDKFKGIGKKTATKIYELLGDGCLKSIVNDPHALDSFKNITAERKEELRAKLKANEDLETIYIELYNYGLTAKMISKLIDRYDNEALSKVRENPYKLIYTVDGFGFRKSDNLALKIGFKYNDAIRIAEGLLYTLNYVCTERGYTFLTDKQIVNSALPLLNSNLSLDEMPISIGVLEDALEKLILEKRAIREDNRIYLSYFYKAEVNLASCILALNKKNEDAYSTLEIKKTISLVEEELDIKYLTLQKDAIEAVLKNNITIITGGPGTGKTTILKGLLLTYKYLEKLNNHENDLESKILMVAPTGRAAKRMAEVTGVKAMTIHKALGYGYDGEFTHDGNNKLTASLLIIDEASMIDIRLANALFQAIPENSKVVIVGDEHQLPSVSPGAVLHDLIASEVFKVIRLKEIMRQLGDSNIIKLAQAIKNQRLTFDLLSQKNQVFFYDVDSQNVLDKIAEFVKLFIDKGGNLNTDLQILVPMYSGVAGIDSINKMIQEKFNLSEEVLIRNNKMFKVGDKVLQLQNEPTLNIMNGDIGVIKAIIKEDNNERLKIDFDGQIINYSANDLDNLTLAYAISIHKSQGSEYENVIMPVVPSYYQMLRRNIIYTAVTRAKSKLIIIGKYPSLLQGINSNDEIRQTSLSRRLVKIITPKIENVIYINDPEIPFDTLGEINMEGITPYSFL